jgi:hypothetical protein
MSIQVTIDRLILEGIELSQRERPLLETAVTTELARLLAENGLPHQAGVAFRERPANPIQVTADPVQLGQQIARSIYGGINQ